MTTTWLNKLDDRQKLIITQYDIGGDSAGGSTIGESVKAALPENYGISVGSVFTDPFNANVTTNPNIEKVAAYLNFSRKAGARVTSVFYSGPEPTEMSVELEFNAFYNAEQEVMKPIIRLMMMSLGSEKSAQDLKEELEQSSSSLLRNYLADSIEAAQNISGGLVDELKIIKGPQPCQIKFGNVMKIDAAYISTAAPSFSNILDNQFMPMSATCAITIKIKRNPVLGDIRGMFEPGYGSTF